MPLSGRGAAKRCKVLHFECCTLVTGCGEFGQIGTNNQASDGQVSSTSASIGAIEVYIPDVTVGGSLPVGF
jgi:hypothetical protein